RTEHDGTAPEDAGGDGALKRFRGRRERHPARLNTWNKPVLRNGDQGRIKDAALRRRGHHTREQQPEMIGETDPPDQFLSEVAAANHDGRFVGGRNRQTVVRLCADLHSYPPGVIYFFVYRKALRITNYAELEVAIRQVRQESIPSFRISKYTDTHE